MFRLLFRILKWAVILSFAQVLVPLLIRSPQARGAAFVIAAGFAACWLLSFIVAPTRTEVIFREHYPTRPDW
jgi:hypothetical protein